MRPTNEARSPLRCRKLIAQPTGRRRYPYRPHKSTDSVRTYFPKKAQHSRLAKCHSHTSYTPAPKTGPPHRTSCCSKTALRAPPPNYRPAGTAKPCRQHRRRLPLRSARPPPLYSLEISTLRSYLVDGQTLADPTPARPFSTAHRTTAPRTTALGRSTPRRGSSCHFSHHNPTPASYHIAPTT